MAANRRTSQRLTLVMLVLVSITVLTLDYHGEASRAIGHVRNGVADALSPFQRGIQAVLHPFGDVVSGALHYGSLETENQRLRNELGQRRANASTLSAEKQSADEVLGLAHLKFANGIPTVVGEVIDLPSSNFEYSVELGVGTGSGVGTGMPVVADNGDEGGLVGTVSRASKGTADVLLITDPRSTVDVALSSGSTWIANGEGQGNQLQLTSPSGTTGSLKVGDVVYTSGLGGGAYPAGIPIGTVSAVHTSASGFKQSASVTPFVKINELQYVSVLQWLQPA